jgi:hypothetical protein
MEHAMKRMSRLKTLSSAAALGASLSLVAGTLSFAQGQGPGPCTYPGGVAVGPEGPAMNGGQLMAGVGQCRRIAAEPYRSERRAGYWTVSQGPYASWEADADAAGFAAGPAAGQAQPIGFSRHHRDWRARLGKKDTGGYVASGQYDESDY